MSLEEQIHSLTITIEKLHDLILTVLEERDDPFSDDASSVEAALGREIEEGDLDEIAESYEESPMKPDLVKEPTIISANEKTLALIALSKEMGIDYLYHNDQLAVDNRVLDEYNRRNLGKQDEIPI